MFAIAINSTSGIAKLYLNGKQTGLSANVGTMPSMASPSDVLVLSQSKSSGPIRRCHCSFSEVEAYRRALTDDEVMLSYSRLMKAFWKHWNQNYVRILKDFEVWIHGKVNLNFFECPVCNLLKVQGQVTPNILEILTDFVIFGVFWSMHQETNVDFYSTFFLILGRDELSRQFYAWFHLLILPKPRKSQIGAWKQKEGKES